MANFNKVEKSGPSSINSGTFANASHVSDAPLNLNIPPSSMSMSTRNMPNENTNQANPSKQFMSHPHAGSNFFNQELASQQNDESAISAQGSPSPKACEALRASEKLESEATIPRSHKTHKMSSFVKVSQNNSFLKTTENNSILSANTLRLQEMTLVKPPSGVMGQETSEQKAR